MTSKKVRLNAAKVIMHMSETELSQYSIDLNPLDGMTDHELLLEIAKQLKEVQSDIKTLKSDVKNINLRIDNLVVKNNLKE